MYQDANSWNRQIITFCAVAVLFIGSLFYFVSTAFKNGAALQARDTQMTDVSQGL